MISGPISRRILCELLGKTDAALEKLIKDNGLPVVRFPGESRSKHKIFFSALLDWMNGRASGHRMTEPQLEAELERAIKRLAQLDKARRERKATRSEAQDAA